MIDDNVRVAVRVRPSLPKEKLSGEQICVKVIKDSQQILVGKDRLFAFDYVISPDEKQDSVYNRCINGLVQSFFEGYNATVFAYGQTGSGKTYTIGGVNTAIYTEDEMGIIPRALQQIFSTIEVGKEEGIEFSVLVSYLELYMEDLHDLLDTSAKEITIREDELGNTIVSGMKEVPCRTIDEVFYCLQHGSAARQTGSTLMNEHSSRSHSVFTVSIEQRWKIGEDNKFDMEVPEQYQYTSSKFHFVDLAGSERAHRTGNIGDRFKESITINTGLLALGNVISALGDPKKKSSHIPYRDSKITRLLKDSLGGNSKTLMICCISPTACDFDESLNSLKYANRARNIKNKPVVNIDTQSVRLEEMQNEIQALRKELEIKDSLLREDTALSARSRGSVLDPQSGEVQQREAELQSLRTACQSLQTLVEEAAGTFTFMESQSILKNGLKTSVAEWLEQFNKLKATGKLPAPSEDTVSVAQLKQEIIKCKEALKSDEEIFNLKTKQFSELQKEHQIGAAKNQILLEELELTKKRCLELEEKLIEQQVVKHNAFDEEVNVRRIQSVPPRERLAEPLGRQIRTSPAMFTLERYMQGFRARSNLLIEKYDDEDEVLHRPFLGFESFEERGQGDLINTALQRNQKSRNHTRTLSFGDVTIQEISDENEDMIEFRTSLEKHQKEIRQAKLKSQEFNSRLRDLTIAIRMKEQLIRQLVKNEKDSAVLVKQHKDKIYSLEEEKQKINKELIELQKDFQKLEAKEKIEINTKRKMQGEYKRRIDSAKRKLANIQTKERETKKLANMSEKTDEKINELQLAVAKMRQQQEELQRKLKQEQERKDKLERDMTKEQHRIRELENINEQQQKVLKIKTEEAAAATRKLRTRSGSISSVNGAILLKDIDDPKLMEQKQWLDTEMEKILDQRKQMEILEKELKSRAAIIMKKEEMMREKGELELKHLRASHHLFPQSVERDLEDLNKERNYMQNERLELDKKLFAAGILSANDERRLLELSEAIEALDAAIEFKSDIIAGKEAELRRSQVLVQHEDNLTNRLKSLSVVEAQNLLSKYFKKVIELRENLQATERQYDDVQVQLDEKNNVLAKMESALESIKMEFDNRLTEQQQEYESQINDLIQKISEKENEEPNTQQFIKIQQLEKDLYYYKKTSRDLKKKLREVMLRAGEHVPALGSSDMHIDEGSEALEQETHAGHPSPTRHSPTYLPPLIMSPAIRASYTSTDGQHVKISRKDLKPISNQEVVMRRSQLQSAQPNRSSIDSLDGH